MDIQGKVFIVTGGASGLGEGTARMLLAHGGKVVIADLQADKGEALAAEFGEQAAFVRCDVSLEADGQAVVDRAEGRAVRIEPLERFASYAAAKQAFAIIRTADSGPYGCFILKKGVVDLPEL